MSQPPIGRLIFQLAILAFLILTLNAQTQKELVIKTSSLALRQVPLDLTLEFDCLYRGRSVQIFVLSVENEDDREVDRVIWSGNATIDNSNSVLLTKVSLENNGNHQLRIKAHVHDANTLESTVKLYVIPGILSILPPLVSVFFAAVLKQSIVALFLGVWVGSTIVNRFNPLSGLVHSIDKYGVEAVVDPFSGKVIWVMILLGGTIALVIKSGGALDLARIITKYVTSRVRAQLGAWSLACCIFFADNESNLIVGTVMRPIMDRMHVSREKLAFIVDSTSAPVSSIALMSGWVGFEVSQISQQFEELNITEWDPYIIFLETIPCRFYPILLIFFIPLGILAQREIGSMLTAERAASQKKNDQERGAISNTEETVVISEHTKPDFTTDITLQAFSDPMLEPDDDKPKRWINIFLPIFGITAGALTGMIFIGVQKTNPSDRSWRTIMSHTDSSQALIWASLLGTFLSIFLVTAQKILPFSAALNVWVKGVQNMMSVLLVLIFAWALGGACKDLQTAKWLISLLGSSLPKGLLPFLIFMLCAATSFATGTSWGTMAIIFPLAVPLAHALGPGDRDYMISAIASILSGSIWGDHCSPISDTTITSSLACGCSVKTHVWTQFPYAIVIGLTSAFLCSLPNGFGVFPIWVCIPLSLGFLYFILFFFGGRTDNEDPTHFSIYWSKLKKKLPPILLFGGKIQPQSPSPTPYNRLEEEQ